MTTRIRAAIGAVLLALVAVTFAACGGSDDGGATGTAADSNALTVYSGRAEEYAGPVYKAFEAQTGIPLNVRYGDSTDLALLIGEEGDRTPAHVFITQSPMAASYLDQRNLLTRLPAATLAKVPARFRAADGDWVGVAGRQRVLVYNTDVVKDADLPASVLDLTAEKYRDTVALAPSNASFQDFVAAMSQIEGTEKTDAWLRGLKANGAKAYAKNGAIVEAVARGEVPMGLVNHYYVHELLEDEPSAPVAAHRFTGADAGSLLLVATASMPTSGSTDPRAVRLINFMLSPEGQKLVVEGEGEYPVVEGVPLARNVPPLSSKDHPAYDLTATTDLKATATQIRESGLAE
jgi:iron(III) transport system substrate-binding protein